LNDAAYSLIQRQTLRIVGLNYTRNKRLYKVLLPTPTVVLVQDWLQLALAGPKHEEVGDFTSVSKAWGGRAEFPS